MIRQINVKGIIYKVKFVDKVDENDNAGECDKLNKIIKIKNDMVPIEKQITLLHEFFHALFHETSISPVIPLELEEIIVDNLAIETIRLFTILGNLAKKKGMKK